MKYTKQILLILIASCLLGSSSSSDQLQDILPEYHNIPVTQLSQDAETIRLALGAAWNDVLDARSFNGYLLGWNLDADRPAEDALIKRGAGLFELVNSVDNGIQSVRLARDSREAYRLPEDIRFWRNELALAAKQVVTYADEARGLREALASRLRKQANKLNLSVEYISPIPWENQEREAWRKAGASVGVRLPVIPYEGGYVDWWYKNLSVKPGYMVGKLLSAGDAFTEPELPVGAWGISCTGKNQYDWKKLNQHVQVIKDRGGKMLLELPTLTEFREKENENKVLADNWITNSYSPPLPLYLQSSPHAFLMKRTGDSTLSAYGGVQLFNAEVAKAYGNFLLAMVENLKQQQLYSTIKAIHLDNCNLEFAAGLPKDIDFSPFTLNRWQNFMINRYITIATLNKSAGTTYNSFDELPLPKLDLLPSARKDWEIFKASSTSSGREESRAWSKYLLGKYGDVTSVNKVLGFNLSVNLLEDKAYNNSSTVSWQLPFLYPAVIGIDYLHFRREWVHDYLNIKEKLIKTAFPDKLIIREMKQFSDHAAMGGSDEDKWSGFLGQQNDMAQWTGSGPQNESVSFMSRSLGPVGFGSRLSDGIESLFRDYLWIHFTNPGNLARYFYHYISQGYYDFQLGWQSVTNHWLTNQLIYQLGPTVANTAPAPQRIGMVLPRATFDLYTGPIYYEYLGWDWMLHAAKLPYTRVDEDLIRQGWLQKSGLKVLILPNVKAMDTEVASAIQKWVENGGTLVASQVPGVEDNYGRKYDTPLLERVLGVTNAGLVSEPVGDTPLTVTIPKGLFTGGSYDGTDRTPQYQVLLPNDESVEVLASYKNGKNAITLNKYGSGKALVLGYPFGRESVLADRTSIGFGRTYTWFVREPQLVVRTKWLREFFIGTLNFKPDYGVEFAEVGRFKGREGVLLNLSAPKGFSQEPGHYSFVRTVGDPRSEHELEVEQEETDMALRFFPRHRKGLDTWYLGISTREVHYMPPRGNVNMFLAKHIYHCRINNPAIQTIWDIARNVPVGFKRDNDGISFSVSLQSGYIMMLAISEKKKVQLFPQDPFPGRSNEQVIADCRKLAGGTTPERIVVLTPEEIRPWLEELSEKNKAGESETILISYGQEPNKTAAEQLANFISGKFNVRTHITQQAAETKDEPPMGSRIRNGSDVTPPRGHEKVLIFIGNEWTNNDMALHAAYWNMGIGNQLGAYGPHLPFTASFNWPGKGRAVVSLSRPYAMVTEEGWKINSFINQDYRIRPVQKKFSLVRRKLYIAGDAADAESAVEAIISLLLKDEKYKKKISQS